MLCADSYNRCTEEFSHEQRWDKADRIDRTVSTLKFNAESSLELGTGSKRALDVFNFEEVQGSPLIMFGSDIVAEQFGQEAKEGRLLAGFALLAILVSCMGLYGLVAFDAGRRTKEIGVRKVLGGNHGSIQALFLRQYFWPMLAANLVVWPLAIWAMQYWLQRFPYKIEPWLLLPICLFASLMVIAIAGTTLGMTVLKACRVKPALLLRYE